MDAVATGDISPFAIGFDLGGPSDRNAFGDQQQGKADRRREVAPTGTGAQQCQDCAEDHQTQQSGAGAPRLRRDEQGGAGDLQDRGDEPPRGRVTPVVKALAVPPRLKAFATPAPVNARAVTIDRAHARALTPVLHACRPRPSAGTLLGCSTRPNARQTGRRGRARCRSTAS